jgi:hypothetical protein
MRLTWFAIMATALSGCGGGGGDSGSSTSPPSAGLTDQMRIQAATDTATSNANCTAIQPFYWEIGNRSVALGSATAGGGTEPSASTPMLIASASKWLFGAYVVQLRNGQLTPADITALTMTSGYTNLTYASCLRLTATAQDAETVNDCFQSANLGGNNSDHDPNADGKFFYNGGHFQKYAAVDLGLGADNNAALRSAIAAQIGTDFSFTYNSPQLAAGISTTASDYAFFLRKIVSNQLVMHDLLGTHAVCTNPATCSSALSTPVPSTESWHYSLAHWVEDDPTVGDGAFSSAGAFGFYPWIDSTKTWYGILGRYSTDANASLLSAQCGRTIRKAWMTGVKQ